MLSLLFLLGCGDNLYGQMPAPREVGRQVTSLPTNTTLQWWSAHPHDPERLLAIVNAPAGNVFIELDGTGTLREWCQDPDRVLSAPTQVGGAPHRAYWDSTDTELGFYDGSKIVRCSASGTFDTVQHSVDYRPQSAIPGAFGHYWWQHDDAGPVFLDYTTGEHSLVDELPSMPITVQKMRQAAGLIAVTHEAAAGTLTVWHFDGTGAPLQPVAVIDYGEHTPVHDEVPGLHLNAVVWRTETGHAVWSQDSPTATALPMALSEHLGGRTYYDDYVRPFLDGSGFFIRQVGAGYVHATGEALSGSHVTASGHTFTFEGDLPSTTVARTHHSGTASTLGPYDLSTEWDLHGTEQSGVDAFAFDNGRCMIQRYGNSWDFNGDPTPWDEGDDAWEVGQQVTLEGPCDGSPRPLIHSQFVFAGAITLHGGTSALKTDALTLIARHGEKLNDSTDYNSPANYVIDHYGWMVDESGTPLPIFGAATHWLIQSEGGVVWHTRADGGVYLIDVSDTL